MKKAIILMNDNTEQIIYGAKKFEMKNKSPISNGTLEIYGEQGLLAVYDGRYIVGVRLTEERKPIGIIRPSTWWLTGK